MRILIMRHAKAGRREPWNPGDQERSLVPDGRLQAQAIARQFGRIAFSAIFSSPYTRCLETLEPLSLECGTEIKPDERLSESTYFSALQSFVMTLEEEGVYAACSHGNVVPALVELLVGRQVRHLPEPIISTRGSIWDITLRRGVAVAVTLVEPMLGREHHYI